MNAKRFIITILIAIVSIAILGRVAIAIFIPEATVTSWYRTPWKNIEVGGARWSWHLIGWAYDLKPATVNIINKARKFGFRFLNEGTHIHLQFFAKHKGV